MGGIKGKFGLFQRPLSDWGPKIVVTQLNLSGFRGLILYHFIGPKISNGNLAIMDSVYVEKNA